jgi:hypothetical protein
MQEEYEKPWISTVFLILPDTRSGRAAACARTSYGRAGQPRPAGPAPATPGWYGPRRPRRPTAHPGCTRLSRDGRHGGRKAARSPGPSGRPTASPYRLPKPSTGARRRAESNVLDLARVPPRSSKSPDGTPWRLCQERIRRRYRSNRSFQASASPAWARISGLRRVSFMAPLPSPDRAILNFFPFI